MIRRLTLLTLVGCLVVVPISWADSTVDLPDATVGNGAPVMIDSNDELRKALSCTNHSVSEAVRWGGATVSSSSGQRFKAEASIEITHRGPVYMISEGADATISCTKERAQ